MTLYEHPGSLTESFELRLPLNYLHRTVGGRIAAVCLILVSQGFSGQLHPDLLESAADSDRRELQATSYPIQDKGYGSSR